MEDFMLKRFSPSQPSLYVKFGSLTRFGSINKFGSQIYVQEQN